MNHNNRTAILHLPEEMRQRAIDLLQLDSIRRIYTQLGYQLQQVSQIQQVVDTMRAGFEQKAVGLKIDTESWEPVEYQIGLQVKSMRNCMRKCVADLVEISKMAEDRRKPGLVPTAEETEQPETTAPARPIVKPAAVTFEEG